MTLQERSSLAIVASICKVCLRDFRGCVIKACLLVCLCKYNSHQLYFKQGKFWNALGLIYQSCLCAW